jgi:hypothetical protein
VGIKVQKLQAKLDKCMEETGFLNDVSSCLFVKIKSETVALELLPSGNFMTYVLIIILIYFRFMKIL